VPGTMIRELENRRRFSHNSEASLMPDPQRSLTRWSLIALGVVAVFAIVYFLTRGFGAGVAVTQ